MLQTANSRGCGRGAHLLTSSRRTDTNAHSHTHTHTHTHSSPSLITLTDALKLANSSHSHSGVRKTQDSTTQTTGVHSLTHKDSLAKTHQSRRLTHKGHPLTHLRKLTRSLTFTHSQSLTYRTLGHGTLTHLLGRRSAANELA